MVIMIILLILCLPLILMLSLFTTTNVVSIVTDVPVTGIEIHNEEMVVLSLEKGEFIEVEYQVMPIEATVKDVQFSFSQYADETLATFRVEGNKLTPLTAGWAKVTLQTVNGGYRDSFIVRVTTTKVTGIDSFVESESITVGETTSIKTQFTPQNAFNQGLEYRVKDGHDVVEIRNGKVKGIGIGTATIEVISLDSPDVKDEVTVTVGSSGVFDFVDSVSYLTVLELSGAVRTVINPSIAEYIVDIEIPTEHVGVIDAYFDEAAGALKYTFLDPVFIGDIDLKLAVTPEGSEPVEKTVTVSRISDISVSWVAKGNEAVYMNEPYPVEINLKPSGANVTYLLTLEYVSGTGVSGNVTSGQEITLEEGTVYTADGGYISVERVGDDIIVTGLYKYDDIDMAGAARTVIKLKVQDNNKPDEAPIELAEKTIIVI